MKRRKRGYVLRARGERQAETHLRITEAMVALHQEIGPRATTVSAIARRAGVERLTVYRHFRAPEEMFAACSGHYLSQNPPPQAAGWSRDLAPECRAAQGLGDIYAYFQRTASMFEKVYRDADSHPALQKIMAGFDGYLGSLADDLADSWPAGPQRDRARILLRHAVRFTTWQSLASDGVPDNRKITLMCEWLTLVGEHV